jgi:hypothetical protein
VLVALIYAAVFALVLAVAFPAYRFWSARRPVVGRRVVYRTAVDGDVVGRVMRVVGPSRAPRVELDVGGSAYGPVPLDAVEFVRVLPLLKPLPVSTQQKLKA